MLHSLGTYYFFGLEKMTRMITDGILQSKYEGGIKNRLIEGLSTPTF